MQIIWYVAPTAWNREPYWDDAMPVDDEQRDRAIARANAWLADHPLDETCTIVARAASSSHLPGHRFDDGSRLNAGGNELAAEVRALTDRAFAHALSTWPRRLPAGPAWMGDPFASPAERERARRERRIDLFGPERSPLDRDY